MPVCNKDEYPEAKYDSNRCIVGYECRQASTKPTACPAAPSPPPCEGGFLESRMDNNGCVVGYDCRRTDQQCQQILTYGRDGAGNCKEFSNSCLPPGWSKVDSCGVYKPFCGDNRCDIGENPNTCSSDCPTDRRDEVYTMQACPDGSRVQCKVTPEGQRFCEQCPVQNLPAGCRQEKDDKGFVRVMCERRHTCPEIPQDVRLKCVEEKGVPVFKKDPSGCEQFFCQFGNEVSNPFSGYQQCPAKDQINAEMNKCSSLGLRGVITFEGGCQIVRCIEDRRQHEEEQCSRATPQEKQQKEAECKSKGFHGIWNRYEGCREILVCATGDVSTCQREMPPEAYQKCSEQGGELIVQNNPNGCIEFSRCIAPSDTSDAYVERPTRVLESTELLSIAFKLESLNVELDKLAQQTGDIATYYKSTGSSEEARFARVSDMFVAAREEVNEIKDKIRSNVDSMTEEDMVEIKRDLKYLKDVVIKDILYVMLSNSDDVREIVTSSGQRAQRSESDCGSDGGCFDRAYRLCKPVTFEPDAEVIVNIEGLDGDNCILKAKFKEGRGPPAGIIQGVNPPYEMTCKVKNYALGMKGPEDIMPFCEGSMLELMKKFGPNGEGTPGVPGKCRGEECRHYCGRGPTEAKECLEHMSQYLPPEAKQGLEMIASGRGGFGPQGFDQGFQQQGYRPQQFIRPEQCEFTDMSDDECVDYIMKTHGTPRECKGLTDAQCRKFLVRKWENQRQSGPHGYGGPQQFEQRFEERGDFGDDFEEEFEERFEGGGFREDFRQPPGPQGIDRFGRG
jgi:hypothetical protein